MKSAIFCTSAAVVALTCGMLTTPAWSQQAGDNARDQVADIVVTAQRREQRLQDVPVAVTALTANTLAVNRITSVRDLDALSPNLTVRQVVGGSRIPNYSMRGLVASGSSIGVDRGVALYVDGVFLAAAQGAIFELGDIERIEVLRGPQGTLFGRNSTGGAISITSANPKGEFGIRQTVSAGNYRQFRSVTHVDTPEFGGLSASANYVHSERRGDIRNLGAGTVWDFRPVGEGVYTSPRYLGGSNLEAVAANLKFDSGDFEAVYKFDLSRETQTSPGQGLYFLSPFGQNLFNAQPAANKASLTPVTKKRPNAVNNAAAVPSRVRNLGHNLTMTYDATDQLSVKNIAAYRKSYYTAPTSQIDGAGGLVVPQSTVPGVATTNLLCPLVGCFSAATAATAQALINASIGRPLTIQGTLTRGRDRQWSDELQFNYDSAFATVTVGGLYFKLKSSRGSIGTPGLPGSRARSGSYNIYSGSYTTSILQPSLRTNGQGGVDSFVTVTSKALYGQGEVHVMDELDLIGGLRYTHDRKIGQDNTIVTAASGVVTSPPAAAAAATSFPIFYEKGNVTYNVGVNYKPNQDVLLYGKYVTGFISGGFFASRPFAQEDAKSFEAGIKADFLDRRLRTNLSLFTVKYTNLQQTTSGTSIGLSSAITQVVVNAGDARAKGFELETTARPIVGLTLGASLGYTDFKYTRIEPFILGAVSRALPDYRSKYTSTLSAQYDTPVSGDMTLVTRIDGNYKSAFNSSASIPLSPADPGTTAANNNATFGFSAAVQAALLRAQRIKGFWTANARVALEHIDFGHGIRGTASIWGRNLLDTKSISYSVGVLAVYSADYERARTYGVDLTIEF